MDRANIDRRYRASSYDTIKRYIPVIRDIIEKTYGEALRNISNPSIMNNKISLNIIDGAKSRQIIHSFALKLKELLIRKLKTNLSVYNYKFFIKIEIFSINFILSIICLSWYLSKIFWVLLIIESSNPNKM